MHNRMTDMAGFHDGPDEQFSTQRGPGSPSARFVPSAVTRALAAAALLTGGLVSGTALGQAPFAETAPDGKTLVVPAELAPKGTAYHTIATDKWQVFFTSEAPLETFDGESRAVLGFVVQGGASPASIEGGEWHLPVESISTGIDLRDEHLANDSWLDAEKHPDIVFQLERVIDVEEQKRGDGFRRYTATLVGQMTLHGRTNPVRMPGTQITLLEESERTKKVAPGDLMQIRSKFKVSLPDYDVSNIAIQFDKVSKEIELDVRLFLSTQRPTA
ncbi:MAG: YceI family protein [Planctomycetota bacterium]